MASLHAKPLVATTKSNRPPIALTTSSKRPPATHAVAAISVIATRPPLRMSHEVSVVGFCPWSRTAVPQKYHEAAGGQESAIAARLVGMPEAPVRMGTGASISLHQWGSVRVVGPTSRDHALFRILSRIGTARQLDRPCQGQEEKTGENRCPYRAHRLPPCSLMGQSVAPICRASVPPTAQDGRHLSQRPGMTDFDTLSAGRGSAGFR